MPVSMPLATVPVLALTGLLVTGLLLLVAATVWQPAPAEVRLDACWLHGNAAAGAAPATVQAGP